LAITVYSPIKDKSSPVKLFINLTPLYPPLLKRRGGRDFREGAKPHHKKAFIIKPPYSKFNSQRSILLIFNEILTAFLQAIYISILR